MYRCVKFKNPYSAEDIKSLQEVLKSIVNKHRSTALELLKYVHAEGKEAKNAWGILDELWELYRDLDCAIDDFGEYATQNYRAYEAVRSILDTKNTDTQ